MIITMDLMFLFLGLISQLQILRQLKVTYARTSLATCTKTTVYKCKMYMQGVHTGCQIDGGSQWHDGLDALFNIPFFSGNTCA